MDTVETVMESGDTAVKFAVAPGKSSAMEPSGVEPVVEPSGVETAAVEPTAVEAAAMPSASVSLG